MSQEELKEFIERRELQLEGTKIAIDVIQEMIEDEGNNGYFTFIMSRLNSKHCLLSMSIRDHKRLLEMSNNCQCTGVVMIMRNEETQEPFCAICEKLIIE